MSGFLQGAQAFQAIVTALALVTAGGWAWFRYVRQADRWAHIETSAEVIFHGFQDGQWLVELVAVLNNKGKTEHRIREFDFDLRGLRYSDRLQRNAECGDQVDFPNELAAGSFLPESLQYFSIGPGVVARYSHVTNIPGDTAVVLLHCFFDYMDRQNFSHSMEATARVPERPTLIG